jgi:hypothetical protein
MEDIMADADNKIMTQPEKIEHILNKGCDYLGIDRNNLTRKSGSRDKDWYKKRFLVPLLFDYTALSYRDIAGFLGYSNHSTPIHHYKIFKEEISGELYGSQKTKMIYTELLSYLNLKYYETTERSNEADKC